jgi:Domain of unknown function (DUF4249)
MIRFIFVIVALFWLGSCTDVLDPSEFEIPDFPVVIGFLSPDTDSIRVYVGRSVQFGTDLDTAFTGTADPAATVILSNEAGERTSLLFNPVSGMYVGANNQLPIVPGRQYSLTTTTQAKTVTATCQVPLRFDTLSYDIIRSGLETFLQVSWLDPVGQPNYYRLTAQYVGRQVQYEVGWDNQCKPRSTLFNDRDKDGQRLTSPPGSLSNYGCNGRNSILTDDKVEVNLIVCDKPYYDYYTSVYAARNAGALSDPVTIYSNINGGQGVFAAYTTLRHIIKLR